MAIITLRGSSINTVGELPMAGEMAPDFALIAADMSAARLSDFKGSRLILNIFPSIDTSTCAASVRKFNQLAASADNMKVLCISRDLPFAQKRFCASEGIDNVINLSDFRSGQFGKDYGVEMTNGKLEGLHARAILVIDENGVILYSGLVGELSEEPDYEMALSALTIDHGI